MAFGTERKMSSQPSVCWGWWVGGWVGGCLRVIEVDGSVVEQEDLCVDEWVGGWVGGWEEISLSFLPNHLFHSERTARTSSVVFFSP